MSPHHDPKIKAAVYERYGGPEVLEVREVPSPKVDDESLLIRVHASSVNRTDCGFLRGEPFIVRFFSGLRKPKATILGCEFAGEVIGFGPGAKGKGFSIGDRVFGFKDDDFGFGGHAELTAMPLRGMIAHIPEGFSFAEAAPSTEGAHYALHYLRAAAVESGHSVLVNGATGAIGSAAVQLLKAIGASVTAVCDTANVELVRSLGAERVVDYTQEDFTKLDDTFDFVFDAVGKSTFGRCRPIMKERGIYSSTEFGPWGQNPLLALGSSVMGKRKVKFPIPKNLPEDMAYIAGLMGDGQFKAVIDRRYSLAEIQDAVRYVETGMKTGNVVIEVQ